MYLVCDLTSKNSLSAAVKWFERARISNKGLKVILTLFIELFFKYLFKSITFTDSWSTSW